MNIGLYQSAAALSTLERWQEAVAQNITSSQAVAFKKRTVEFSALPMGRINLDPNSKHAESEGASVLFPKASYGINFQAGEVTPTGRELDVAIKGEGFFEVQTPDGARAYTRAGELHLRPDRTLGTSSGYTFMSDGGSPIALLPQGGQITISEDGTVAQGGTQLGRLGVVRFNNLSQLLPASGGVFMLKDGGSLPVPVAQPQVLQGYVEGSNVTPLREMISLIQIARAYEANQKIISSRDQALQRTLETLG